MSENALGSRVIGAGSQAMRRLGSTIRSGQPRTTRRSA
jgi:hypothetical protein